MCSPTVTDISKSIWEMGDYDPHEILFIVQGEMEYTESWEDE